MTPRKNKKQQWAADLEAYFLAAYDEHSDALFRHVLIRVRDRETAKDIVQEAFSRTWLYLSEGKKIEYIRAFLYRVANNLIVDGSRKKKSSSLDALMDDDGFEVADANDTILVEDDDYSPNAAVGDKVGFATSWLIIMCLFNQSTINKCPLTFKVMIKGHACI